MNPDDSSARTFTLAALVDEYRRAQYERDRQGFMQREFQRPGPAYYINNPWNELLVMGGIGARGLAGLDPTDQQRLGDAFSQFPARNYGRMPQR